MRLEDIQMGDRIPIDDTDEPVIYPEWLNMAKFKRGQLFFQKHLLAMTHAMHCSLVIGFALSNLLVPLVFTKQSHEPKKALDRYLLTFYYLLVWHTCDVWKPESFGFKQVQKVRKMHHNVAKKMKESNYYKIDYSDLNLPAGKTFYFSQYDMALVQSGFMGAVVLYPTQIGVNCTISDIEDYIHFWRGIGYLLGIKDEFNICSGSYEETLDICSSIEQKVINSLKNPPVQYHNMASAYCNGLNLFFRIPAFSPNAVCTYMFMLSNQKQQFQSFTKYDIFPYYFIRFVIFICWWCPCIERLISSLILKKVYGTFPIGTETVKPM